jgi:hypothetical protein
MKHIASLSLLDKPLWIQNRMEAANNIVVHVQEAQSVVSGNEPWQLSQTLT